MTTIFLNGDILTMTESQAQAVVVTDGRIVLAGPEELARAYFQAPDTRTVDLSGATLMPAFIDAHSHLSAVANSLLTVSLAGVRSYDELGARIRAYMEENKPEAGRWVTADGLLPDDLKEGRMPDAAVLDAICPDHPLAVKHQSGHSGSFNSLALKALGVTGATPSPAGGLIEKANGAPTGFMEENAFISYIQKTPMPHLRELTDAFRRAQDIYLSNGVTTVQEGMLVSSMLPLYKHLTDAGLLTCDVAAYASMPCADEARADFPTRYSRHFRLAGYKIFLDGSPQGRTAWLKAPYQGSGGHGSGVMSDEAVYEAVRKAGEDNMQLLAHCNGDAACEQFLNAVARAESENPRIAQMRDVIIHAQLLSPAQLPRVKALQLIPSFFVAHTYHFGDVHVKNLGLERASRISPAASALGEGVVFTFHQDAPVIAPNMLETVWCACVRQTKSGRVLGENERLTPYEALKAVTVNAAYQYFEEKEKGALRPGMRADLVILDKNPLKVSPDGLKSIRVLSTWKDGEKVWEA